MKLPWVSRDEYERVVYNHAAFGKNDESFFEYLNAQINAAEARAAAAEVRYADLLAKYHTLRIATGANPAEQHVAPPKPERDIVSEAIIVRSGNNVHLRRHYAEYVTFQRAAGIADVEIAAGILEGEVEEDGTP